MNTLNPEEILKLHLLERRLHEARTQRFTCSRRHTKDSQRWSIASARSRRLP